MQTPLLMEHLLKCGLKPDLILTVAMLQWPSLEKTLHQVDINPANLTLRCYWGVPLPLPRHSMASLGYLLSPKGNTVWILCFLCGFTICLKIPEQCFVLLVSEIWKIAPGGMQFSWHTFSLNLECLRVHHPCWGRQLWLVYFHYYMWWESNELKQVKCLKHCLAEREHSTHGHYHCNYLPACAWRLS